MKGKEFEMGDSKVKESTQQKPQKRQPPWMKIEVKGSGGILLLGGIFFATAFTAVRMRRKTKRLPGSGTNSEDRVVANDADVAIDEENCGSLNKEKHIDEEMLREPICGVQEDMHVCEVDQNPRSLQKNSDISMDSMIDVAEVASETCYSDIKEVLSDVCELHKIYLNEKNVGQTDVIDIEKEQSTTSEEMLSSTELHSEETNSTNKEEKEQSASSDEMLSSNELQREETDSTNTDDKPEVDEDLRTEPQMVIDVHQHQQNLDECALSCADERECEEMVLADSQLSICDDRMKETFNNSEFSVSGEETEDNETLSTESHLIDAESASDISSLTIQSVEVQELKKDAMETEPNFVMNKAELNKEMTEFEHVAKTNEDCLYVTKVAILSKVEVDDAKNATHVVDTNGTGHNVIKILQIKEIIGGDAAQEFAPVKEIGEAKKDALQSEPLQEATEASPDGEVKMTEEGSDGTILSSVSCNAEAIRPAELVEQDRCEELAANNTDALSEVMEIEDNIHSEVSEEEEEIYMTEKNTSTANMSLMDLDSKNSFISNHSHRGISLLLAAITLLISIYLSQLLSTSVES